MADEPFDTEGGLEDQLPLRPPTEGVRIIGATEAAESVARAEDGGAPPAGLDEPTSSYQGVDAGPSTVPPVRVTTSPDTSGVSDLPPVEPGQSFEMPHYAEPPTGQVPKVVIGEETDSRWSGLADQPRWRDTEHQFDEQVGLDHLIDDAPKLGALEEPTRSDNFFADLDLTDDTTSTVSSPVSTEQRAVSSGSIDPVAAAAPELDEPVTRRPPTPRRRRPEGDGAGRSAVGADAGGGGRDVPLAAGVGVGLLAIGIACFYIGAVTSMILIAVILCLCAVELFSTLDKSGYRPAGLLGIAAVAGLAIAPLYEGVFAYPIILGLTVLGGLAWFLFVQPGEGAVMNLGVTLLGVCYVGGLGSFGTLLLGQARPFETGKLSNQGIGIMIAAVLVTVSYDVGAFFIGRALGHTPLSAASPNKTQEGLIGGVLVALVVPVIIIWATDIAPVGGSASDIKTIIAFCLICAVMAPVGDLCESALKRDLGVKDMGSFLPGHGGVLDRFDSMLFVLPTAYFMAHLLELGKPAGIF